MRSLVIALALVLTAAGTANAAAGRGVPTGKFAAVRCAHGKLCGRRCIPRRQACHAATPLFGGSHGDDTPTESRNGSSRY